jgi:hypothetical protein
MTLLSNHARVCPRCTNPGFPGWLVREADGYIHCISCGFVSHDPGFKSPSFKIVFANLRDYPDDDLHHTSRRKEEYYSPALEEVNNCLESCCRSHGIEAGVLPICRTCQKTYDFLAEKSVDSHIKSEDIYEVIKFKREVCDARH